MRSGQWMILMAASLATAACSAKAGPVDTGKVEAASTDDRAEQMQIVAQVEAAIKADNYAALDAMGQSFRTSRARTPSGLWKLASYHSALQFYLGDGLTKDKGCGYRQADFVKAWRAASKDQPAAVITDASLLAAQAWCFRGSGYAASVADEDMARFEQGSAKALALLTAHKAGASIDPEFYAVMVKTYPALGKIGAPLDALVEEASAREPYYHRTWFNAAFYHLPQWGGSLAEIDQFARLAAYHTRESDKTGMYVRVYWYLEECDCGVMDQAADWDDITQSMADVQERYPSAHNADYFARLACERGDVETGKRFIRAAAPGNDDEALVARFDGCRTSAAEAGQS